MVAALDDVQVVLGVERDAARSVQLTRGASGLTPACEPLFGSVPTRIRYDSVRVVPADDVLVLVRRVHPSVPVEGNPARPDEVLAGEVSQMVLVEGGLADASVVPVVHLLGNLVPLVQHEDDLARRDGEVGRIAESSHRPVVLVCRASQRPVEVPRSARGRCRNHVCSATPVPALLPARRRRGPWRTPGVCRRGRPRGRGRDRRSRYPSASEICPSMCSP